VASLLARPPRSRGDDAASRRFLPTTALAALAAAAVLPLALVALTLALVVVQTLDPSGALSVGDCAALAGRLLLLGEGGELRLGSGPLVLAPLLLTAALAWGLSRAVRWVVRAREVGPGRGVAAVAVAAAGTQVVLSLLLAAILNSASARIGWPRTVVGVVVLAGLTAGWGAVRESGVLDGVLDRLPGAARPVLRAVLAGLLAALALSTAVVAVALASDARGYAALNGSLGGGVGGAAGLLGLAVLLQPNAAAAALGLAAGPGFVVGTGTLVSVHGVTLGAVPALPLLAALPDTQAVPLLAFVSQGIPVLAGLVAGTALGRWLGDDDGGSVIAALWGLVTGVGMGLASAAVVLVAGGSLGNGALATVGAPALETGLAVAAQAGIAAAVAGAVTRWRALG
jgi:hypothetical protein